MDPQDPEEGFPALDEDTGAPGPEGPGREAAARLPIPPVDRRQIRRAQRAARKAAKAAEKAARQARKAARKAGRAADAADRRAADAASAQARADALVGRLNTGAVPRPAGDAGTMQPAGERVRASAGNGMRPVARTGERPGDISAIAGSVLAEVADLVRHASQPAAARIVERVTSRPDWPALAGSSPLVGVLRDERAAEAEVAAPAAPAEVTAEPGMVAPPAFAAPAEATAEPVVVIPAGAPIGAAVDVGANSVHLLVGAVDGHSVIPLVDESVFLGLGDRVSEHGFIGAPLRDEVALALATYAERARQLGATDITVIGTEPIRRAADASALVAEVGARAGVPLHVLDHHEEAILNLLGVTKGAPIDRELLVVDIGGGSSEVIVAAPGRRVASTGLRLGSAQLTRDVVRDDPPTRAQLQAAREVARVVVRAAPAARPADLVAVGGTASNVVRLLAEAAGDRVLTHDRIWTALAMLGAEPSAELAERYLLRPARARILPAGAIILDAILERYAADRIRIVDEGIREGAVLAAATAGAAWRDRLESLAEGWDLEAMGTPA